MANLDELFGKKASRIVLGTASDSFLKGEDQSKILDEAFSLGINFLDTARAYGGSEKTIGKWMKERGNRDQLILLSKGGHPGPIFNRIKEKEIRKDLERSLMELGTDHIDLYMLHRDDKKVDVKDIVTWMAALIQEGKILAYGFSNWEGKRIEEAIDWAKKLGLPSPIATSPNYSLAHQKEDPWGHHSVSLSGEENLSQVAFYRESQIAVFAYSALSRGFFSGRFKAKEREKAKQVLDRFAIKAFDEEENYLRLSRVEELAEKKNAKVSQIAIRWLFEQGMDLYAILQSSSKKHLQEALDALKIEMSQEEAAYLNLGIY